MVPDPDRLFVLEAVYEGYLLHYGEPRAFAGMDADLRLLAGDALYALGLPRLAERGRPGGGGRALGPDLRSRPAPRPRATRERAEGLWLATARELG